MPRHPPCALKNLTTKMLASTVQFSNNKPKTTHTRQHQHPIRRSGRYTDMRGQAETHKHPHPPIPTNPAPPNQGATRPAQTDKCGACCFRTQQCTNESFHTRASRSHPIPTTNPERPTTRRSCTSKHPSTPQPEKSASTNEHHPRHTRP